MYIMLIIIIALELYSDLLQPIYFTSFITFNPSQHPGK